VEVLAANLSALQEVGFFQKKIRQGPFWALGAYTEEICMVKID
jgi:hypothetical protein